MFDTLPAHNKPGSALDYDEQLHMYDSVMLHPAAAKKSLKIKELNKSTSQLSPRTKAAIKNQSKPGVGILTAIGSK